MAGSVPNEVVSTSTVMLQDFADGRVPPALTWMVGGPPEDLLQFRDAIGRQGRNRRTHRMLAR